MMKKKNTNPAVDQKDYSISLRLTLTEADRIKKICDRTKQSISDFLRQGINTHLDLEEIRIMEIDVKKKELEARLATK
jgi:hypothetical protein